MAELSINDQDVPMASSPPFTVTITVQRLSYKVNIQKNSIRLPWKPRRAGESLEWKPILDDISLKAYPGELLAVVGPSGAGKSSLLDAVAGLVSGKGLSGSIFLNGRPRSPRVFKRLAGYVTQEDALFPFLTVRETLLYSARLRLPSSMSLQQKQDRVEAVLTELGLLSVAGARVGNIDNRGISGGERRRLSIAVDLIHNPAVLLLDEPTSGLDSRSALNVVTTLHAMAANHSRTILLTVHQPSARMLSMFHRVAVLSRGRLLHHGSLADLVEAVTGTGRCVPPHMNVMEYVIDSLEDDTQDLVIAVPDEAEHGRFVNRDMGGGLEFMGASLATSYRKGQQENGVGSGDGACPHKATIVIEVEPWVDVNCGFSNSIFQETYVLTERYYKNIFRTKELFATRATQIFFCGICLGTLFYNIPSTEQEQVQRLGFLGFSLAFLLTSSIEALPIFLQERQILLRETSSAAYRTSSYVMASTLVFLPFLLLLSILFSAPAYWLVGFSPSIFPFLFFTLTLWVVLLTANSIVACFASLAPNYITGNAMIAGIMGAYFLFSGYFIQQQYIPSYWIWAHYLSVYKYPLDALLVNEYSFLADRCTLQQISSSNGSAICLQTGSQYLSSIQLGASNKWVDLIVLLSYAFLYRIGCYFILRFMQRRTRA